jgi:periplasmic protein TonB
MAGYVHDSGYNQRRMVAFAVIVALHVFIGWAFVTGFGQSMVHQAQQILETTIIKQDEAKELPPPPPKPDLKPPPPPTVPVPIINVNVPIEAPPMVVSKTPPPAPRPVAVVASTPVKTVQQPDCGEDYYPSQALRLGQAGSAVVRVCINVSNKIDGPIELLTSSGFPSLDEAAGKCMAAGRFKAGTVEGKPVRSCKDYKVTFKPKEAH